MRGCSASCLVGTDDFLSSFCFRSILHARRHSSQQVCRHRITGQQLSEHPAADTGRSWVIYWQFFSLCRRVRRKLSCFHCNYWSNSGNLLTAWMYAKIFLIPSLPETCCTVSSTSSLAPSHSSPSMCAFVHLYFTVRVWFTICAQLFIWHTWSLPFRLLYSQLFFSLLASFPFPPLPPLFFLLLFLRPFSFTTLCSLSAFYFLLLSPSFFLPFTTLHLIHVPPPLPPVLFSLMSNHTRLEPAQLHSSTHGNHLKLLC